MIPTETKHTHTPGPWRIVASNEIAAGNLLVAVSERAVNGHANARLIAAAPDLLAALELALATLERVAPHHTHGPFCTVQGSIDQARAAISRATDSR